MRQRVRVTNERTTRLRPIVEPWANEYPIEPGTSCEVEFTCPESAHALEVEDGDEALVVYGWVGSTYRVTSAARADLDASDPNNPPPPVP